jgi:hypothetical protein
LFQDIPANHIHYYGGMGGHLRYHGNIDFKDFERIDKKQQSLYIWNEAYRYLQIASRFIKNESLFEASEYAYKNGIETELNLNYRLIETVVTLNDQLTKASVWINFEDDKMISKFTLEKNDKIIFSRDLDSTNLGIESFLEIYKKIDFEKNSFIIKGSREVDYLPMKIAIDEIV